MQGKMTRMRDAIIEKVQITRKGKNRVVKTTVSFQLQDNEEDFIAFLVAKQSEIIQFAIAEKNE